MESIVPWTGMGSNQSTTLFPHEQRYESEEELGFKKKEVDIVLGHIQISN